MGASESIELYDPNVSRAPGDGPERAADYNDLTSLEKDKILSADNDTTTGHLQRTAPRPMWFMLIGLVVLLIITILALGLRCGLDDDCNAFGTPSLGTFINNTHTSPLATTSVVMLMGIHYTITVATTHMLPLKGTGFIRLALVITSLLLYASVFAAIVYPAWFMAIIPVGIGVIWIGESLLALRRYYKYDRKRTPFRISFWIAVLYTIASLLYLVFSAIPIPDFPGRQTGVFITEIFMLVSGLFYLIVLVFHARKVSYMFQTTKSAENYIEV